MSRIGFLGCRTSCTSAFATSPFPWYFRLSSYLQRQPGGVSALPWKRVTHPGPGQHIKDRAMQCRVEHTCFTMWFGNGYSTGAEGSAVRMRCAYRTASLALRLALRLSRATPLSLPHARHRTGGRRPGPAGRGSCSSRRRSWPRTLVPPRRSASPASRTPRGP